MFSDIRATTVVNHAGRFSTLVASAGSRTWEDFLADRIVTPIRRRSAAYGPGQCSGHWLHGRRLIGNKTSFDELLHDVICATTVASNCSKMLKGCRMAKGISAWLAELKPGTNLSASQNRVVEVLSTNPYNASFQNLSQIAERTDVNKATVVRTAQSLGFTGWTALQQELRAHYLSSLSLEETLGEHRATSRSAVHQALSQDVRNLSSAVEIINPETVDTVIDLLAKSTRVLAIGMGSAAAPVLLFSHLGSNMGHPIHAEDRGGVHFAAALNQLGPGDVLFTVNLWRPMEAMLDAIKSARRAGITTVALTDLSTGLIAENSDHVLAFSSEGVSFFQSVTAATSIIYGLLAGMERANPGDTQRALAIGTSFSGISPWMRYCYSVSH